MQQAPHSIGQAIDFKVLIPMQLGIRDDTNLHSLLSLCPGARSIRSNGSVFEQLLSLL
jgi:hypothetical protein